MPLRIVIATITILRNQEDIVEVKEEGESAASFTDPVFV